MVFCFLCIKPLDLKIRFACLSGTLFIFIVVIVIVIIVMDIIRPFSILRERVPTRADLPSTLSCIGGDYSVIHVEDVRARLMMLEHMRLNADNLVSTLSRVIELHGPNICE